MPTLPDGRYISEPDVVQTAPLPAFSSVDMRDTFDAKSLLTVVMRELLSESEDVRELIRLAFDVSEVERFEIVTTLLAKSLL